MYGKSYCDIIDIHCIGDGWHKLRQVRQKQNFANCILRKFSRTKFRNYDVYKEVANDKKDSRNDRGAKC